MGNIGTQELVIILVIVLLLFGARRIPEIARSMGQGIREFKKAAKDITSEVNTKEDEGEKRPAGPPENKPGA